MKVELILPLDRGSLIINLSRVPCVGERISDGDPKNFHVVTEVTHIAYPELFKIVAIIRVQG